MTDLLPLSERARDLHERVSAFQREVVEPAKVEYFAHIAQAGRSMLKAAHA